MTQTTQTVTVKPTGGNRFYKGVSAIKDAGGVYDADTKTWEVPANKWYQLASDRDVEALSEAPVYRGGTSWVMESTGEEVE